MSWFGWGSSKKEEEDPAKAEGEAKEGEDASVGAAEIKVEAPLVSDLLKQHKDKVDELRKATADVLGPEHDDLFLLRYILSRKTVDKADPALRKGIEWRKANASWLAAAKDANGKAPYADQIERFTAVDLHKLNNDGGAVMVIRAGLTPVKQLMEVATVPQLTDWFMFKKEQTFIICDEATRRTGRLVKTVVLNDATGIPGLWELTGLIRNNGLMTALGDSSKLSESVYPQLVSVSVILNPPTFVKMVFKLVKVFMSASMMEKVKLCGGDINTGDMKDCPFAARLVPVKDIPTFLGGQCSCPGGCVAKIPNDQMHKKGLDADGNTIPVDGPKTPREGEEEGNNNNNNNNSASKSDKKKKKK